MEEDGIVKCRCGYDGDAKMRQGSTGVANTDIPIKVDLMFRRIYLYLISNLDQLCIDVGTGCSHLQRLLSPPKGSLQVNKCVDAMTPKWSNLSK